MKTIEIRVHNVTDIKKQRKEFIQSLLGIPGSGQPGLLEQFNQDFGFIDEITGTEEGFLSVTDVLEREMIYMSPLTLLTGALCPLDEDDGLAQFVVHNGVVDCPELNQYYNMEDITYQFISYLVSQNSDIDIFESSIDYELTESTMVEKYFFANIAQSQGMPDDLFFPLSRELNQNEILHLAATLSLITEESFTLIHLAVPKELTQIKCNKVLALIPH